MKDWAIQLATGVGVVALSIYCLLVVSSGPEVIEQEYSSRIGEEVDSGEVSARRNPEAEASAIQFKSMAEFSGIDMKYYGSPSAEKYMTEQNGGGVALADFDNDGELDVFLVNGSNFREPAEVVEAESRLYRSTLSDFSFEDVTRSSSLLTMGFGMGCTAGDFDNDGFTDLLITRFGPNQLWHNNGDGTFSEHRLLSTECQDAWSCSAAMADLDSDGDLDMYITNYVDWTADHAPCFFPHEQRVRISCSPMSQSGQPDQLLSNLGDGTFEDSSDVSGICLPEAGKGLGIAVADFNEDSRLDIYVANDMTPNFLLVGDGTGAFEELAAVEGVATSEDGTIAAGMGVAVGDYNRDGHFDVFVTNFQDQVHDAFESLGGDGFVARNWQLGLDLLSQQKLSFGIVLEDFDLDQFPDLFVANGHVWDITGIDPSFRYAMQPSLYQNKSGVRYRDVSANAGNYFLRSWVGRAAAAGDLDNDGDTDLVVTHINSIPAVLKNTSSRHGGSVVLRLVGTRSARQPLGVRVTAEFSEMTITRQLPSGGSFQACHDPRTIIATGDESVIHRLTVQWSEHSTQKWENLPVSGAITLVEGRRQPAVWEPCELIDDM